MKKSKRNASRSKKGFFAGKSAHRRRQKTTWRFEQLESRMVFSTTPLETGQLSSDTLEGAAAIWLRELEWAARQAAGTGEAEYSALALPNDPAFSFQWHLLNIGQEVGNPDFQTVFGVAGEDINVVPVWNMGYTGEGVVVAVIDTGVQTIHPDLIDNLHPFLRFNTINGTNNPNPSLVDPGGFHGTAVAGIIAATANNGIGGTGVAPGATIVPILFLGFFENGDAVDAFQYAWQEIDITNNSWGPGLERVAFPLTPEELTVLRDTVISGRDGLGTIHVFASGNGAGPAFSPGFETIGEYASSSYNPWVNSRYTIGVTGVDHDGLYANFDGTFTAYPTAGPSVLVAAPTGSNAAQNVADDEGQGSGIWTTDLLGDFGANSGPDENGFEPDRDFWPDADATSRFNGTSAAAPMVSGVIALMLEANPNLTYRDVQEILVRSARQNAQFEIPSSGGIEGLKSTWQTNQNGIFRNPDPYDPTDPAWSGVFDALFNPLADPNIGFFPREGHYESQPALFTNGAGYTVSQGYGVYSEQIGYAHGVVDAELAVQMAEQWHSLSQDIAPDTERTFTTFVEQFGGLNLRAAERLPLDRSALLIPGALFGDAGFSDYWNEYFEDDPFADYDGPSEAARGTYLTFEVPDNQATNLEWVDVKIDINGPPEDLDFIRITLVSPDGTHSELNNFYTDPSFLPYSHQPGSGANEATALDPAGDIHPSEGNFVWTFSTNRHWGERTSSVPITDAITGEPLLDSNGQPIMRGWELHIENWSDSDFSLQGLEIAWHGKPLAEGTQRVQGLVGIDQNSDGDFNYGRYVQSVNPGNPLDPSIIRNGDVVRALDLTQEAFAENILVEAFLVENGVAQTDPTARFLTGADGNYYLDLLPFNDINGNGVYDGGAEELEYVIRITDPLDRTLLDDVDTSPLYQRHYLSEWTITSDWFNAPDRVDPDPFDLGPGEILFDNIEGAPVNFVDGNGATVASGVKGINFLIKDPLPAQEFVVNGTVIADIDGNGSFGGNDTPVGDIFVYWDANRNGVHDSGEMMVQTSNDPLDQGAYSMTIPAAAASTFAIGVIAPSIDWTPTNPDSGVQDIFARPGDEIDNVNFFLDPPDDAFPPDGHNLPGNIFGAVYNDSNANGVRNPGEGGVAGIRVYIDANENGVFDDGELEAITTSLGGYSFADVAPGLHRIEIEHSSSWALTSPAAGYREVEFGPGGVVKNVLFGLDNLADSDWGDLPDSFSTLAASGGPSHVIVPGFSLGSSLFGKVNGLPSPNADADNDDDGVVVISNGGVLQPGLNTLQVTVAGTGGLLNGWIDFDGDGTFVGDPNEQVFVDIDLNPGTHFLSVFAPQDIVDGALGARFRWGEEGLSFTGPATIGEVEDYFFNSTAAATFLVGDYDGDGVVGESDKVLWRASFGSMLDFRADGNGDGVVDAADYTILRDNWGATLSTGTVISLASEGGSGSAVTEGQSSGSSGASYVPLSGTHGSSLSTPSALAALVSQSASPLAFASEFTVASSQPGVNSSHFNSASANQRNELLDLALASLVDDRQQEDSLAERELFEDEEQEISELALAIAWEDDSWWSL